MRKFYYVLIFISLLAILRIIFIEIYIIKQNSMKDAYRNGDIVLIIKNFYKVEINDVIIFNYENENLIKRCIGLPGDSVKIYQEKIFVNNREIFGSKESNIDKRKKNNILIEHLIYTSYGPNWNYTDEQYYIVPKKGMKIILNSKNKHLYSSIIKRENENFSIKDESYYIFKNDYFYLVGDNRNESIDSRFFGPIKSSNIKGKVIFPKN